MPEPVRSSRARSLWRRASASDDTGAGSVEYVGITLVVVLVIGSVLMLVTPIGNTVAAKLCAAFGTSCGDSSAISASVPKAAPTRPCTVQTDGTHIEAGVDVSIIHVGESGDMSVETMSDGTYKVTVNGKMGAQAVLSAGKAGGSLQVGEYGAAVDLEASIAGGVYGGAGVDYTFANEGDATEFTDWVTRSVAKGGASAIANGVAPGLGAGVQAAGWIWDKVTGYSYTPPAPDASFYEAGVTGDGGAAAGVGSAGGSASASVEEALGLKIDNTTGEKTLYGRVSIDAEAAVQLGLSATDGNWGAGGEGSASVEMVVATTFDKNGELSNVSLDAAATAEGAGSLTALVGYPLQGGGGKGVTVSASFPVTAANRVAMTKALAGLAVPGTVSRDVVLSQIASVPDTVKQFITQGRSQGDITAQFVDVNSSNLVDAALSLEAPAVGGLGFNFGLSQSHSTSTDPWYLGNNGWNKWTACVATK
jgi:hypothetical protein